MLDYFAYSRELVNEELAKVRYKASMEPGFQESFSSMFPAPRQRWVEAMATPEEEIRALPHRTLIVHGREDKVIPLETSLKLEQLLDNADLSVFSHCGHWSMIERTADFNRLVRDFFLGSADQAGHHRRGRVGSGGHQDQAAARGRTDRRPG